nr:MAG TPA: pectinesterase family protein [Caudoviricetes sp.]
MCSLMSCKRWRQTMKPFKEVIDGIRKAVMASEVREDIAQGLEYVEQFANTAGENIQKIIDPTLSLSGKAADAAKVGEAVGQLKEDLVALTRSTSNFFSSLTFFDENSIGFDKKPRHFGGWYLSNYVDVENYKYLSVKLKGFNDIVTHDNIAPVVFYDALKNVDTVPQLNEYYQITGDTQIELYGFIKIPSSAKYARFNLYKEETTGWVTKLYNGISSPLIVSNQGECDTFTINGAMSAFELGSNVSIYIKKGVYNEVVKFDNHYNSVSLIGEDRDFCVIQDGTGVYINSPVVINGNFIIKNLTIKATLDDANGWIPTYNDSNVVNTYPSYALHIDGHGLSDTEQAYGTVENCVIYSEAFPSVGMGVNKNQTVEFNNCVIERNCTNLAFRNANWAGAFYCHNAVDADAYNQFLILKNNTIKCNYGYSSHIKCTVGATLESGFYFELEATNNNLYSKDVEYSGCKYERGQSSISGLSHGNSNNTLNTLVTSDTPTKFSNIFNENIATNKGSLQSGEIKPSTGWRVTDYLKPNLGGTIEYRAETVNGAISLAEFYDENHNEITEYRLAPVNGMSGGKYTIPNDDRIKYVRYCMSVNNEQFSGSTYINADLYLAKEK